jgi:DNA-nicking Smr family endonuclease
LIDDLDLWLEYTKSIEKFDSTKVNRVKKVVIPSSTSAPNLSTKLDLHGYTQEQAFTELKRFLESAYHNGVREVLIITGKGRLDHPSVIKLAVPRWLEYTELKGFINSYSSAKAKQGGEGAISIMIKRKKT